MNETNKMFNIIHQNCKEKQMQRKVAEIEKEKNSKKREYKNIAILVVLTLAVITLFFVHQEREIKNCMDQGGSEAFCRYAGE